VTGPNISAEKRVVEELGCEIAAGEATSLVIQYHHAHQRAQLISALKPLGWTHPVDDQGDADAMLLDIRRAAAPARRTYPGNLTLKSALAPQIVVGAFVCLMIGAAMYGVGKDFTKHNIFQGVISGLTYLLIIAFVLYGGLQYVTLKVWLTPQEIVFVNFFRKVTLRVTAIQTCNVEMFLTFGAPFYNFTFTTRDGKVFRIPVPFKGFHNLKDELRKRYQFSVSP
jgi:hypothetical protein